MNAIPGKIKYFFLLLSLCFITNLYPTTTDIFLAVTFVISGIFFHLKGLKYDIGIVYIIVFFILINIGTVYFYGMFQIPALLGMVLRLLIPYYIIKILKEDFFIVFENTIYFLAIISIPFYLLQLIKPDIYLLLSPIFRSMTTDTRYEAKIYSFVIHTVHYRVLSRNAGFAWEPGGFGYALGIAVMFNIVRNNFTFTKKSIILFLVGLTTLSTTFYIFVLISLSFYLFEQKRNVVLLYFALPILIVLFIYVNQLPFMSDKIEGSFEKGSNIAQTIESTNNSEAGRFAGLIFDLNRFIDNPFGYGINQGGKGKNIQGELITGASGFGIILRFWGITGLFFLFYSLYSLSGRLALIYRNQNKIFIMITILLFLFSNPIAREPIFLMLIYLPLFILKKTNLVGNKQLEVISFVQ